MSEEKKGSAGRPALPPGCRRVRVVLYLSPTTADELKRRGGRTYLEGLLIWKENTRLQRAAPALLEACKEALLILDGRTGTEELREAIDYHLPYTEAPYHFLAAAIARAEGTGNADGNV